MQIPNCYCFGLRYLYYFYRDFLTCWLSSFNFSLKEYWMALWKVMSGSAPKHENNPSHASLCHCSGTVKHTFKCLQVPPVLLKGLLCKCIEMLQNQGAGFLRHDHKEVHAYNDTFNSIHIRKWASTQEKILLNLLNMKLWSYWTPQPHILAPSGLSPESWSRF